MYSVYTGPCTGLRILFRRTILWDWEAIILLAFRYWKVQKRAYELLPRSFDSIFVNYKCIFNCYLLCISCSGYHCALCSTGSNRQKSLREIEFRAMCV